MSISIDSLTDEGGPRDLNGRAATAAAVGVADAAPPMSDRVARIGPESGWVGLVAEVRDYREVVCFLVIRNLKIRYRQTILGAFGPPSSR